MQPSMLPGKTEHLPEDRKHNMQMASDAHAGSPDADSGYAGFFAALVEGNRQQCRAIFEAWLAEGIDVRVLYQERIQRALYRIGELWEQGRVSVATEHLASAIAEGLLNLVTPQLLAMPKNGMSVVVSCTANEYHQIGARMVADLFEMNGWRSYFLGANVPVADVIALIRTKQPDLIALSLAIYFNLGTLLGALRLIRENFAAIPVLVGGHAFDEGGREQVESIEGVHLIASLQDLEAWLHAEGRDAH